jgi:hypothetical protein
MYLKLPSLFVNLKVCPEYPFIWRYERGVPRSEKSVITLQTHQHISFVLQSHENLLVNALLMRVEVVPKHISILQVRLRIPLLRMNQQRKQRRIPNEEHGRVVEHPIPIPFFSEKLHAETTGITRCVCGALFAAYGGEAGYEWCFLAYLGENVGVALMNFSGGFERCGWERGRTMSVMS